MVTFSRWVVSKARPRKTIGKQPSPICQAAAGIGGSGTGNRLDSTVPSAKPIAPVSAIAMPGSFSAVAEMPLPPMMAASPANAITSATVRSHVGRSPSTGQASSEAHTGMV